MTPWVVLVNPRAGARPRPPQEISAVLHRHGVEHEIEVVPDAETMRSKVVGVVGDDRHLALAGGDGTTALAVDALVEAGAAASAPPLGLLPIGSGCDLLRTFGISGDLDAAAVRLARGGEYRIDVGVLEGEWGRRRFVNVAQAGVGAAAAQTAVLLPRRLGPARYPMAFGLRLPRFPACRVEVSGRRPIAGRALAVVLANGQFFAGGWNVAPRAMLVDGELDVQVFDVRKRQAPALVPKIVKGVHLGYPGVTRRSLAALDLRTEVPWPVEADGEYLGSTPVRVSVLPQAIALRV